MSNTEVNQENIEDIEQELDYKVYDWQGQFHY